MKSSASELGLTHNVITQNVIQVGTRSTTKSDDYSINGMCIQVYSSRLLVGVKGYQIFH